MDLTVSWDRWLREQDVDCVLEATTPVTAPPRGSFGHPAKTTTNLAAFTSLWNLLRSPVELAADAAREALTDTGAAPGIVAAVIDTAAGIRQFETSTPGAPAPLGRSNNYPRSVAQRVGAAPARAILEVAGGQGPQHLVNELAAAIAAGSCQAALVFGSEAISTAQRLAKDAMTGPTSPNRSTATWRTAATA
ncbi:hypothetical protein [Actinomadura physcomitrii]|uniref:hypothetical protein n=1 Tax=Actinomadura physcomitrii TaxID=2650748 RepID=UPI001921C39A|nr:hypothetical protein [Actinomadura physcomitrii]